MEEYKNLGDEELIEKVRKYDTELYAIIIKRYEDKLFRYTLRIVQEKNKAIDIVQETFIKAFINLNNFNTKKKFSSWIYRIAHNETLNLIKKHKSEIPLQENWDFQSEENIENEYSKTEEKEEVEKCLSNIPLLYREPLSLYYIDEKSYEEISDILQIPKGTVATRINRAKKIMKKICQK